MYVYIYTYIYIYIYIYRKKGFKVEYTRALKDICIYIKYIYI